MARLQCPFDGTVVVDGGEPAPGTCPGCGAVWDGGGETPPEGVALALAAWGLEGDPAALAGALFADDPPAAPQPALAITSDSREGFYLWWLFARGDAAVALAALTV